MLKQFGARATEKEKNTYARSPYWKDGSFVNLEETRMGFDLPAFPGLLYHQFIRKNNRSPRKKINILQEMIPARPHFSKMRARWFGHSVLFLQIHSLNILIDPMFGENAAPISPFPIKRFSRKTFDIIKTLPELDLILLSHDHYDHLDYHSIRELKKKTRFFLVALGVKRHLIKWGVKSERVKEMDWWETFLLEDLLITFTPTRHFSGRGPRDRATSLWGGWVLKTGEENIWFSGDGGYGSHFKEIGRRLGPFDLGFMECGQYSPFWQPVHLFPEESVQAAMDAQVKKIMPIHWAAFALAQHSWTDPVVRFVKSAEQGKIDFILPEPGVEFQQSSMVQEKWWQKYE